MLLERIFQAGGAICAALGILLLATLVWLGFPYPLLAFVPGAALFLFFGFFFFRVAQGARKERRALLALGGPSTTEGVPPPRSG
jgi:hypothetical protein